VAITDLNVAIELMNGFLMINKLHIPSNSDKSGNRGTFVATIVANVATDKIWLDTTGLMDGGVAFF
jgi:hypothetical protein